MPARRKILVVGAGHYQLDGLKQAAEMGLDIIATDGNPNAPGFQLAHQSFPLDIYDQAAHVELARKEKVDAVISFATDAALLTVLAVREALDLPGTERAHVELGINKGRQRALCEKHGIRSPTFRVFTKQQEPSTSGLRFPIIVKPVDSAGSRGITILENSGKFPEAAAHARNQSRSGEIVVEEFVRGTECTIEGFAVNGKHQVLAVSEKVKGFGTPMISSEIRYPPAFNAAKVEALVNAVFAAMELKNASTHTEVIVDEAGEPWLVEAAVRGGGFHIFDRATRMVSGFDPVEAWIRVCLGESPKLSLPARRACVLRFIYPGPGRIQRIRGLEALRSLPGVDCDILAQENEVVGALSWDGARIGTLITSGTDLAEADQRQAEANRILAFEMEGTGRG